MFEAVRRSELTKEVALQRHERVTEMKTRLLGDQVSRRTAWLIARKQGWTSTHDAEYLAVTRLQADALVTVGPVLTAKAKGLVPLAPFAALTGAFDHEQRLTGEAPRVDARFDGERRPSVPRHVASFRHRHPLCLRLAQGSARGRRDFSQVRGNR